jgi:MYXO-CTERM domain-containing protein
MAAACADVDGSAPASGISEEAIVGGQPDSTSHNVVGIILREGELCSGSLILPNLVLTARHCVATLSGGGESVQCGVTTFGTVHPATDFVVSWDDNLRDNITDTFQVSSVKVPTASGVCGNDIALLELSSNVPADQATPLVPRLDTPPATNEVFDAVGYGLTNPNDTAGTTAGKRMRFDGGKVTCVGSACANLGAVAGEWAGQVPVCSGDSGGPALDANNQVIGATSRGPSDCQSAVYSSVSSWKSFIVDAATSATNDGNYSPPGWVTGMRDTDAGTPTDGGTPPPDGGAGMSTQGGGMAGHAGTGVAGGGRTGVSSGTAGVGAAGVGNAGRTSGGVAGFGGSPASSSGMSSSGATSGGSANGGMASGGAANGGAGVKTTNASGAANGGAANGGASVSAAGLGGASGKPANRGGAGALSSSPPLPNETKPSAAAGCGCRTVPSTAALGFESWSLSLGIFAAALRRRRRSARANA